jgi:nucleotide-binding universal stress UspA family protein
VDGSECGARAAGWLERFPLPERCEVHLITVLPPHFTSLHAEYRVWQSLQAEYDKLYAQERGAARDRLDALHTAFMLADKRATVSVETGDPAHALLNTAEQDRADLLVVGSHGRSGIGRFLLGSVSEKVMRHVDCSVLVVRGNESNSRAQ